MIGTGLAIFIASVLGLAGLGLVLAVREPKTLGARSRDALAFGSLYGGLTGDSGAASGDSGGACSGGGDCG